MNAEEKNIILEKFKHWFRESLIESHKKNTLKLVDVDKFNINPFLLYYLANFLEGNSNPESLAKALLYPRILGTSITTSFGTHMQSFITKVLQGYGSLISGLDIEFIDQLDGRRKYCQLKSGPNALNRDDVETISKKFKSIKHLARTNQINIDLSDLVFCLTYGEENEKNSFIKELEKEHPVFMGQEFWFRFTGDRNFYKDLIFSAGSVANEVDMKSVVDKVVSDLSRTVENRFNDLWS